MKAPPNQDALLRRRCRTALANHRKRAAAEGKALDYGLHDLLSMASRAQLCPYCRTPLGSDAQWDHAEPTGRGGAHEMGNLSLVCNRCNRLKGALTHTEFTSLRMFLRNLHPAAAADVERRLLAGGRVYQRRKGGRRR